MSRERKKYPVNVKGLRLLAKNDARLGKRSGCLTCLKEKANMKRFTEDKAPRTVLLDHKMRSSW